MVHKKYTYKNGKRFGPYYYETKRVDGKVVTTYLGSELPVKSKNFFVPFIFLGIIVVLLLSFFYFTTFTGRVTLDVKSNYNPGEEITGALNLNVMAGELIPAGSKIVVIFNGVEKEFFLSDLVDSDSIQGEFYVENLEISGEGEGYGLIGKREVYPEVEFEIKISDKSEEPSEETEETATDFGEGEGGSDGQESSENSDEQPVEPEGTVEEENGEEPGNEGTTEEPEGTIEEPEGTVEEEMPAESPESQTEETAEEPGESSEPPAESGDAGITGEVTSEGFIYGKVTKEKSFEYEVGDRDAKIVKGSVEVEGEKADDNLVKLKVRNGVAEISTGYSVEEEGFGEDFLGNEKKKISIDLSEFGLMALNDSLLSVKLVYQDNVIVEAEKDISVVEPEVEETNESAGEPIIEKNESIINESINESIGEIINATFNETFTNETLANQTIIDSNITVNITQYGAVLGQPVKWKKRIDLQEGPATVSVEIPAGAENVSIRKLDEKKDRENRNGGLEEAEDNEEEINSGEQNILGNESEEEKGNFPDNESEIEEGSESFSINVGITGEVTADLELEKQSKIMKFIERIFTFTGFIISEDVNEVIVDLNETEDAVEIEYYTEAPVAVEEELDRGKRIRVTGPDDVHYQNVLISSELNESLGIRNPSKIRIYWQENDTYLDASLVSDLDDNGVYDYLEFVAPHLSNQTFDIIVITNAEHLDSSRQFVSDVYNETYAFDGVWSETISESEYVRAYFEANLTSERDIKIYARKTRANPSIEIYEKDGVDLIASASVVSGDYTVFSLLSLVGEQDTFDIKIVSGDVQIDHIVDPVPKFFEDCTDLSEWTILPSGLWFAGSGATVGLCEAKNLGGAERIMSSPAVDLSGETSVNLTFDFATRNMESGEFLRAYVYNGTGSYVQLIQIEPAEPDGTKNFSLQDFITLTSTVQIRFGCNNNANNERCLLDNINITTYQATDTISPGVTIVTPENATYNATDFPLIFNVSLSETGDTVLYSFDGGATNITMSTTDNVYYTFTNESMPTGSYTFQVYANDTSGNRNYTESTIFSVDNTRINSCGNITNAGRYTLNNNFSGPGNCLEVKGNDIVIDGNGKTITGDGGIQDVGILVSGLTNVTVRNINISNYGVGLFLNRTNNSLAENITVDLSTGRGVYLLDSSHNTLANSTIYPASGKKAFELKFHSTNNTIIDTNVLYSDIEDPDVEGIDFVDFSGDEEVSLIDVVVTNYSINASGLKLDYKISGKGRIHFLEAISGSGESLDDHIQIENSVVYLKTGDNPGLDKPANVTLYNVPTSYKNPAILKDGVICEDCWNFTSLNAGTVIFNVTGFSTYTIDDVSVFGILENVTAQNNFTHISIDNRTTNSPYNDLFLYIPFDTNTSTTKVYDYSSYNSDGTPVGNAKYQEDGVYGDYFFFDGKGGDRISLTGTKVDEFGLNRNFSVSAWVRTDTSSAVDRMIISDYNLGTNRGWALYTDPNGNLTFVIRRGNSFVRCILDSIRDNQWHFVAGGYNGAGDKKATCQLDSSVDASSIYGGLDFGSNSVGPAIGDLNDGSSAAPWNGSIDEVLIFNESLNFDEGQAIYQNTSPRFKHLGEQTFEGINVSTDGTEDKLNISLTESLNFPVVNFTVRVANSTAGAYAYGPEFQVTGGNASDIPIGTPTNLSVRIIFHPDVNRFYSPLLVGNITFTGWSSVAGDASPPDVTINVPKAGDNYYSTDLPINFTVSLNEKGDAEYSLDGGASNTTMFTSNGGRTGTLLNYSLSTLSTGSYTFQVYANDTTGNRNYTESVNFVFNTTGADINFTSPTPANGGFAGNSLFVNLSTGGEGQGAHYAFTDFDDTLVLWLMMDYANGTRGVTDLSKYGNNGTLIANSIQNRSGKFGKSMEFDGVGDYIEIADSDSLDVHKNFTWAAWIYLREGTKDVMFSKGASGIGAVLEISGSSLSIRERAGPTIVTGTQTISDNAWHHVAAVYNMTDVSLYVNGVLDINSSFSITGDEESTTTLRIGKDHLDIGISQHKGMIDEAMMFSRALSSDEISYLYDAATNKYENNITGLRFASHTFTGYVVNDVGTKNQTEQRSVTIRPEHIKIDANTDCIGLLANATTFGYGSNYTEQCRALDPSLNVCPALDADLNITITGRLNVDSDCKIFFNSTHIGEFALYLEGVMNLSNGFISTINASNTYNFSAPATHASFVDSRGTIERSDIISPLNVSDSLITFKTTGVKDRLVLINSTDLESYTVSGGSVYRQFRLNATVRDDSDNLVPGVNVSAWNVTNDRIFSQTTNGKGAIFYNLTEYADDGNGKSFWNNYTVNHTKVGYRYANDTSLNITQDYVLNLTLELYDTIVVNTEETPAQIFTRVGDSTVFSNLSDASRNCRYRSNAIINITSGGNLIMENCTLEMGNDLADGEFNLFVNSGGAITANFSNLTNAFNNLHYRFAAMTGSVLNIKNSYILLTGDTEGNLRRGFAINTTSVTFSNNTVGKSYNADIEILSSNIVLDKVSFVGNKGAGVTTDYNVYCRYCINVTISGSNLSDSTGASVVVLDDQEMILLDSNYTTHSVQPGATLYKQWYVDSFVNDTSASPLLDANVSFFNVTNALTDSGLTNNTGGIRLNVSDFVVSGTAGGGTKNYQGNYTINATKAGYSNEEQSWNVTGNLRLDFATLTNPFPTFVLNSPANGSTEYFEGSLNITLNATVYDLYQDILEVRIYGVNETGTSDFYTHGLIYKNSGITNGTEITYNWSSPVKVPDESTVFLMHFDNLTEYGENSSYVRDFNYLSNNATLVGDGRPVSGKLGGAFELDGISPDYLESAHSSLYNVPNITITAWIKPYSTGNKGYIVSKDDDLGGSEGFWFKFDYGQNYTDFDTGSDSPVNGSPNSLIRNEWQHVAVTMNATTITFYVNGQNVGVNTGSYSITTNTKSLLIGTSREIAGGAGTPSGLNGSIDDLVIYNRTLDYQEINDSYRLKRGTYLWKVNITDNGDNGNESEQRQFTIGVGPINQGPAAPSPEINSTDGSNRTAQDLNCFDTLIDAEGDVMNVSVEWYKNSALHLAQEYNNNYANNSFFNAVLESGNTSKTESWTCGIRIFDGVDYSSWTNTTGNVTILNTLPDIPGLSSPADGSATTDRTPMFSWTGTPNDDDGDVVSFDLNITCYNTAGGPCAGSGNDDRLITGISSTTETLTSELQYFIDNNDYYNWTVRAYDGEEYSSWATDYSLNITALVDVTLPNGSVEFGVVSPLGNYDTTDDSPKPFLIQNDGTVFVNISISATDLWAKQLNPSRYYQYKIANYTLENGSFNWALSRIFFRNLSTSAETAIVELNYSNATDTAEIDINISVPLDEPADVRSSTVTFTASLTE